MNLSASKSKTRINRVRTVTNCKRIFAKFITGFISWTYKAPKINFKNSIWNTLFTNIFNMWMEKKIAPPPPKMGKGCDQGTYKTGNKNIKDAPKT